MEHHAPHRTAKVDGYYSKFDLPTGAHLAIVVSKVHGAKQRPHMLSFTYVPRDTNEVFQKEVWAKDLRLETLSADNSFICKLESNGFIRWEADGTTTYRLDHEEFSFYARSSNRTPWSAETSTPESLLVNLPLPLHWHVNSLASSCEYKLKIHSYGLPSADTSGKATVHEEKNWAHSFPSSHMWVQARDGQRGFCCAGGHILGMEAFLLGYRSAKYNVDFRPPFATRLASMSPFMSYNTDWDNRTFELSVQSFRQKLVLAAKAPKGSFFSLSSPFPEGHRENFLGQSFQATLDVKIYESGWLSGWQLVHEDYFEGASLEFGGGFYPPAGSKERLH